MRVLITGGAGHIGSKLARFLLNSDHEVIICDDLSCGYIETAVELVEHGATFVQCDAADPALLNDHGPFDAAYHFAAYAAECMSPFCRRYNYTNNLVTTAGLVSNLIAAGFEGGLVFASSIAVYGRLGAPFHETSACVPVDPYGIAKLACERDIAVAGEQHGLNWCIVRPHNVYGPGQSLWQRYRNVLGLWMRAALEGEPVVVFGDGRQTRAFTYVDDILEPLLSAGDVSRASRQIINLGGSTQISIAELLEVFTRATGWSVIRNEPARHEVRHAYCTAKKSEELLGYKDKTSLEDGIKIMWEWSQEAWKQYPYRRDHPVRPMLDDVEVITGMPAVWQRDLGVQSNSGQRTADIVE